MTSIKTRLTTVFSSSLAVLITGAVLYAGPLNPPAGPVASTYKTLNEIEPRIAINLANTPGDADSLYKITQPGSYYLTGNVVGVPAKHGIEIAADSVVVDLNGFAVISSGIGLDGVSSAGSPRVSITVRNGIVSAWGDKGIDLSGTGHIIDGVHARVNATTGISVGDGAVITNSQASGNQLYGIATGTGCAISTCTVFNNVQVGITTDGYCTLSAVAAVSNGSHGIQPGLYCTMHNCTASGNQGDGFNSSKGCTFSSSAASSNDGHGFNVSDASSVIDCTARFNTLDGIRCTDSSTIRGNTCAENGNGVGDGAGIHATSVDNRIEGNTCTTADRGIDVDAPGNFISRNICSANTTNWSVAANNKCLVVLGNNAAAINGDSGGISPGSTDPNANFTY
jgi:hypothetical protein